MQNGLVGLFGKTQYVLIARNEPGNAPPAARLRVSLQAFRGLDIELVVSNVMAV